MPRSPLRIRTDFGRLLAIIQTSALLHQLQRGRNKDGRMIATVHDYANAYVLGAGVFTESLVTVPAATHELLLVVNQIYERKHLKDDDDATVSYAELMAETAVTSLGDHGTWWAFGGHVPLANQHTSRQ